MGCMLLPHEVDGGICSRSQRTQELIVVETGGASGRLDWLDEDVVQNAIAISRTDCGRTSTTRALE